MHKKAVIGSLLLGIGVVFLWSFFSGTVSNLILPDPKEVFEVLIEGLVSGRFYPHIFVTLMEVFSGLLIGVILGMSVGIMIGEYPFLREMLSVYIVISQAVPKIALAPLFMLWFGYGMTSKIVITALICFFPLLESTASAIQQVNEDQLALFKLMHAKRWQILWHLKLPAGLPTILQGFRVAAILALVGAAVGEFIGANQGLGALIIASQGMMDTTLMFAVLIILSAIGLLLYILVEGVERQLLKYKKEEK